MEAAVGISNEFGFNLLNLYRQTNLDGNLFFSSFSITTTLLMLYGGSRNITKTQIENVLHLNQTDQSIHKEFHSLLNSLKDSSEDTIVKIVNGLFLDKSYKILSDFSDNLKVNYNADSTMLDFKSDPDKAREEINQLIEMATIHKIKDMFPVDSIGADTKLILANAIYFKGMWNLPFSKNKTEKKPFYTLSNEEVMVDMMYMKEDYKYYHHKGLNASFLELPYSGNEFSMIVILPDMKDGLPTIENQISLADINTAIKEMYLKRDIHLSLPRFKLEESLELNPILMDMGMKDAFTGNADLSGISGRKDLLVSSVLHKAFVEVNEEGTEAAAATGIKIVPLSKRPRFNFAVDHPFMFVIRENAKGLILFTGSIYKFY